jgi:hypothetical protein
MKYIIYFISIFAICYTGYYFFSVNNSNTKDQASSEYTQLKDGIQQNRRAFYSKEYNRKEIKQYLFNVLNEEVFPLWVGTDWDYNGTTRTPQKGSIACGYFVMTTLEDVGFICNRSKFAQQASSKIVNSFCDKENIKVFGNRSFGQFYDYCSKYENEVFVVGLDNHVGYVINDHGVLYAVHSSIIPNDIVIRELLTCSESFRNSKIHYVRRILESDYALKKWRVGQKIALR